MAVSLSTLARRYLAHRRKLGFLLRVEGQQVLKFAQFADRAAPHRPITTALALQWATLPRTPNRRLYHAKRLESLRGFAKFCAVLDPRTEVPLTHLIGPAHRRQAPHIYPAAQVRLLLRRAAALPLKFHPAEPLRALTYVTLIGLLACTGLRMGEALRLREKDFDEQAGTLRVPRAKFGAERILPLHSSAVRALRRYQSARHRHPVLTDRFFVGRGGAPLSQQTVHYTFRGLTRDLVANGARSNVRFHDFRHSLATRLIAKWSRQDAPIAHHLLLLSRYLGHRSFCETFWYISADPRSLQAVSDRFNRFSHDPNRTNDPVPLPRAAILCRASARSAQRQPTNHSCLPGHLPATAWVSFRSPPSPR